jgi:predicted ATP-grasp superfamily ATP-dependent carboligase
VSAASPPRVLVVYGLGSAGPLEIEDACGDDVRPVFAYDGADPHSAAVSGLLAASGRALDLHGLSTATAVSRLAGDRPEGIVCFSEDMLRRAAELACDLGLPFHDAATTHALTDKLEQRRRLVAAGMPSPPFARVASPSELRSAARAIGLPAVLKPARGAGSVDTSALLSDRDVEQAAVDTWSEGVPRPFVLEGLLGGAPHPAGDWLGDYVSVESYALAGVYRHLCVSDKLPLARPFRETGMLIPSSLPSERAAEVERLAERALRACGVVDGMAHTEIKLTPDGPRVIEVNGRLGGSVARLLRRLSPLDPVRMAIDVARGVAPRADGGPRGVSLQYFAAAPAEAVRVVRPPDGARLRALDGVYCVEQFARAGDPVDWRTGTLGRLCTVWAEAPSLEEARRLVESIRAECERSAVFDERRARSGASALEPAAAAAAPT